MIALIDTLFAPLFGWLAQLQDTLTNASIPLSQSMPITTLFSPIAILSPAWQLVVTNIFAMAFIYLIIHMVINGVGLIETFRNAVKWW